jgi:hypothetical protein
MKHDGDFSGLVYAPYASIVVKNSGDFMGVAWGEDVEIKNSGNFYIDIALRQNFLLDTINMLSWKELRE